MNLNELYDSSTLECPEWYTRKNFADLFRRDSTTRYISSGWFQEQDQSRYLKPCISLRYVVHTGGVTAFLITEEE